MTSSKATVEKKPSAIELLSFDLGGAVDLQCQLIHLALKNVDDDLTVEALLKSIGHFNDSLRDCANKLHHLSEELAKKGGAQ